MIFSTDCVKVYPNAYEFPSDSRYISVTFSPKFKFDCYEHLCSTCRFNNDPNHCSTYVLDYLLASTDLPTLHPELLL